MANGTTRTPKKDAEFLELLSRGATVGAAARGAGYARRSLYRWRKAREDFAAAWDEAVEEGTDELEDEALRRAKDGFDEPRFYEGEVCGHVRRYSDTLIIFLLKARRPEKYSDRVTHQGPDGGPVTQITRVIVESALQPAAEPRPEIEAPEASHPCDCFASRDGLVPAAAPLSTGTVT